MNWNAIAALMSIATLGSVVAGFIWMGGKMAQTVHDHGVRLDEHAGKFVTHEVKHDALERRVTTNDIAIGRLEEWKNGYNAAASVSGNVERKN